MTMWRKFTTIGPAIAVVVAVAAFALSRSTSSGADSTTVFSAVAPTLKSTASFTVLLPKYLPNDVMSQTVYAVIESNSSSQYVVDYAYSSNCKGNTACSIGEVTGQTTALPLTGTATTLSNGATAYFVNGVCKAYCSPSTITWHYGTAYYQVSMRGGDQATLVSIANSMGTY
jgi:hypothetical protein